MTSAAARAAARRSHATIVILVVVVAGLAVFAGDGFAAVPLRVGLPLIAVAWLATCSACLGRSGLAFLDRNAKLALWGAVALTGWAGLSLIWSIAGDASWTWLNRLAVVVAMLALGLAVGAHHLGVRLTLTGLTVVVGAALSWALAGLVVPALAPYGDRIARLQEPVGYWNALALLAGAGLGFASWLLADRRSSVRVVGALLAFGATTVMLATQSRAGVLAAVAVLVLALRAAPHRLETAVRLLLATLPGLAVGAWILSRPALVDDGAGRAARVDEAPKVAIALALGVLATVVLTRVRATHLVATRPDDVRRGLRLALVAVCLAGLVGLVAAVGNPASWSRDQLGSRECVNSADRFIKPCDNNRLAWWGDALQIARDEPVAGTGAGTYHLARLAVRSDGSTVTQPHSVPFQLLADLGVVGLVLGLITALGAILGIRGTLTRLRGGDRWAATSLAALPLAWGVHALVDSGLDVIAVAGPTSLATGVLLAAGRPTRRPRAGASGAAAATGIALLAAVSLLLPALAVRAVDDVYAASLPEQLEQAATAARRARSLNPLSFDPVLAQAYVADAAGDTDRAIELYEHAVEMQPRNPDPLLALAYYHYLARPPRYCAAYEAFNDAYTLDQKSKRWIPGGPLDVSRDKVNEGACEPS